LSYFQTNQSAAMNENIKPYTPLYRKRVEACAKCEPFNVVVGEPFLFWLPGTDNPNDRYELYTIIDDIQYTLIRGEITELTDGIITSLLWNVNDELEANIGFTSNAPIDVRGKCLDVYLQRVQIPDTFPIDPPIITDLGAIGTFKFITQTLCNSYVRLDYYLDCNQPLPYTYWLKGAFRRQPQLLADELNAVTPSGGQKRVYSRYIKPYLLKSFAFGWDEHDFLEVITCSYALQVNGVAYEPTEGSTWTVNSPTNAYMTGQIDLVEGGRIVATCCDVTDESSSPA
jgi:hypothetical protein